MNFTTLNILELLLNYVPIYIGVLLHALTYRENNLFKKFVQSLFYVYTFCLIFYTVSLIPYHKIFTNDMMARELWVLPPYNLIPFNIFNTSVTSLNVYGNLFLLFPLGIMLPIMHKKYLSLSKFIIIAFTTVLLIETVQLIATVLIGAFEPSGYQRAFDIDDFIFNCLGGLVGFFTCKFLIYPLLRITRIDSILKV